MTPLSNGTSYQLVMNHDYDLLDWKVWYGFLGQLRRKTRTRTAAELAEEPVTSRRMAPVPAD